MHTVIGLATGESSPTSRKIFIVHGKDQENKDILKRLLLEFGLEPIILAEQPNRGRTLIEKLIDHTSDVGYVFVLMTPDDVGSLKLDFTMFVDYLMKGLLPRLSSILSELNRVIKARVRQNVIFEYGLCVGALGRGLVCPLVKGDIEIPSDILGSLYIPFKERVSEDNCVRQIMRELEGAGYVIRKHSIPGILERGPNGRQHLIIPADNVTSKEAVAVILFAYHPTHLSYGEIGDLLSSSWKMTKPHVVRARASELKAEGKLIVEGGRYRLSDAGIEWVQSEVLSRLRR